MTIVFVFAATTAIASAAVLLWEFAADRECPHDWAMAFLWAIVVCAAYGLGGLAPGRSEEVVDDQPPTTSDNVLIGYRYTAAIAPCCSSRTASHASGLQGGGP